MPFVALECVSSPLSEAGGPWSVDAAAMLCANDSGRGAGSIAVNSTDAITLLVAGR